MVVDRSESIAAYRDHHLAPSLRLLDQENPWTSLHFSQPGRSMQWTFPPTPRPLHHAGISLHLPPSLQPGRFTQWTSLRLLDQRPRMTTNLPPWTIPEPPSVSSTWKSRKRRCPTGTMQSLSCQKDSWFLFVLFWFDFFIRVVHTSYITTAGEKHLQIAPKIDSFLWIYILYGPDFSRSCSLSLYS